MNTIIQYIRTLDRRAFNGVTRKCKKQWEKELKEKPQPFEERLKPIPELLEELKHSSN